MSNRNSKTAAEAVQADNAAAQQHAAPDAVGGESTPDTAAPEAAAQVDDSASLRQQVELLTREKAELQQQLTDERQRSGDLAGELNESQTMVEDLQKRVETAETLQTQSGTVIVSDGEAHYKVLAPKFKHKGVQYTAQELKANQELVQQLVAAGVGFLQKVEA